MEELTTRQVEKQTVADFFTFLNLVLNDSSMAQIDDSRKEAAMLDRLKRVRIGPGLVFDWSTSRTPCRRR